MEKTKAEGYEALRKIEEILKGFDPERTYIGKAFEGCVEQAEENLRYDGMMSWKAEYESKNREVARLTEKLAEVNKKLRESEVARVDLTKELSQKDDTIARLEEVTDKLHESEEHRVELTKQLNQKDDTIARYVGVVQGKDREIHRLSGVLGEKAAAYENLEDKLEEAQGQISDLRQTILELKAKLYDMMTGKEVSG